MLPERESATPEPTMWKDSEVGLTVVQVVGLNDLLRVVRNTGTFNLESTQNDRDGDLKSAAWLSNSEPSKSPEAHGKSPST